MATMARNSKGDRDAMLTRLPRELGSAVRRRASESGLSISDYIATVLAAEVGMPDLALTQRIDQELPMTG